MANHQFAQLAFAALLLTACGKPAESPSLAGESLQDPTPAVSGWRLSSAQAAVRATTRLVNEIRAYLEAPEPGKIDSLRSSWHRAHELYLAAAVLEPRDQGVQPDIESWPIAPGFLDDIPGYPESGVVNDYTLDITSATLRAQHQVTHEEESALGFHVLEYYLFRRPESDLAPGSPDNERRRQLILLVADLLLLDQLAFARQFSPDPDLETASVSYPVLLESVRKTVKLLFSEYNQLGQHNVFAGRSPQQVLVQLKALKSLLAKPVDLNSYLVEVEPVLTRQFNASLEQAIGLIPEEGPVPESDSSRVLLLLASLSHNLDDLSDRITRLAGPA